MKHVECSWYNLLYTMQPSSIFTFRVLYHYWVKKERGQVNEKIFELKGGNIEKRKETRKRWIHTHVLILSDWQSAISSLETHGQMWYTLSITHWVCWNTCVQTHSFLVSFFVIPTFPLFNLKNFSFTYSVYEVLFICNVHK